MVAGPNPAEGSTILVVIKDLISDIRSSVQRFKTSTNSHCASKSNQNLQELEHQKCKGI
jgi:hypothetical protein